MEIQSRSFSFLDKSNPELLKFWNNISITANDDKCWDWKCCTNKKGYGIVRINKKNWLTHRLAYFLNYKIDPIDKLVCHSCDNPKCVNQKHLWIGTNKENMHDKITKGRSGYEKRKTLRGEENGYSKLTSVQILEIRNLYQTTKTSYRKLSKFFNVGTSHISRIVKKQVWKHI